MVPVTCDGKVEPVGKQVVLVRKPLDFAEFPAACASK
jgi:hypothetical protein